MRTPRWLQGDGQSGGRRQLPPSSLHSLFTLVALYGGAHTTWSPDDLDSHSATQSVLGQSTLSHLNVFLWK